MSVEVIAPGFERPATEPVGDWHPSRFTPSLTGTDDFHSAADALFVLLAVIGWQTTEGPLLLDAWQVWLIRRALEVYPPDWPVEHLRGKLRYKRIVISMGRQNGKSIIGAVLAFFLLTRHVRGPKVGGFASIESQARIIYDRVRFAVEKTPELTEKLRATKTRGIHYRDDTGLYATFPAKEESLQGEPFTGALYDELHLGDMGLWDAIVMGQRSKPSGLIAGVTTAGDASSLLLKRLYSEGEKALAGEDERMGFFVWESKTDEFDKDYTPTEADVIAGNPSVACGRIPLADVMDDTMRTWAAPADESGVVGRDRVIRYTLNRFLEGAADAWVPATQYNSRITDDRPEVGHLAPVYGIQRTAGWEHATVTANYNQSGRTYTELVATINAPNESTLEQVCRDLARADRRAAFAMPSNTLRPLALKLREDGIETWALGATEMAQAVASAKGSVKSGTLTHDGSPLARIQSAWAKTRVTDAGARLSEHLSAGDIDAITAQIAGLFVVAHRTEDVQQLH